MVYDSSPKQPRVCCMFLFSLSLSHALPTFMPVAVTKLMEMHGDNSTEDVGMEMEREDEGEEVADAEE